MSKKQESAFSDIIEEINLQHSVLKKRKDGLIILLCNDNHVYTVDEVKENHEAIKKLSPIKKAFVLNIAGKYTSAEPEAKSFTALGTHSGFIAAEAFVIQNLAQRILAQFYFKINKPIVASSYFTDLKKAEAWILRQKAKYERSSTI